MFGPDLLVAPILYSGQRSRSVYLPAGCKWTNAWTGETCEGSRTVQVDAPIEQIPLFIRAGAEVSGLIGKLE
jgi:alpha-D-xyloside xylohydrolase